VPGDRIHYLPNGVDTTLFHPADDNARRALRISLDLPLEKPVALYVGVMDERKNIEWLARQWIEQDAFGTDALLVAIGPQSREDPQGALIARLRAMQAASPDRFCLRAHSANIEDYLRAADVLVLPSHREGLPNVVLEAMASGLPCVAAEVSGTRDLVQHGRTGYTYAPDDPVALAAAVSGALSPCGRELGDNGRRIAEERFSLESVAQGYSRLYSELIAATHD
ncbi:MAG TPA: glycosyltransferase family 4 protein, partial [Methyloversatilis sp.]